MFDSYGIYIHHHALCLRKQCCALLARRTFAKVSPLARVDFGYPLPVRSSPKHGPYKPFDQRSSYPQFFDWRNTKTFRGHSIYDVLFKYRRSMRHGKKLAREPPLDRFHHVEAMDQLFIVLKTVLFPSGRFPHCHGWSAEERGHLSRVLGTLIETTIVMQDKSFNTFNYAHELPEFTRIFRLFVITALPVPRILMFHGLKAAACGNSPTAMMHYLLLYHQQLKADPAYGLLSKSWSMIVKCILISTRPSPSRSEKTLRHQKAWTEVLTYRIDEPSLDINSSEEEILGRAGFSMYTILIEFGVPGLSNYFRLITRFCESLTIFEQGMNYLVLGRYDRNLSPTILNSIFNSFIQALIAKNSPEQAWKLAHKALPEFGAIQDKTWTLLFRYPEFLTEWKPGWENPVMVALERYMSQAERQLGVKWIEGEHGFLHMPRDEEPGQQ